MMNKIKALVLAGLAALPVMVNAQPATHDWEVILGGSGTANTEFRSQGTTPGGSFGATLSLGYYLTENLEVAGRQTIQYNTSGMWNGASGAALDYNFRFDKFVPFVGANVSYLYGNRGYDDTWSAGPEAGVKFYLQEKAFLFGMGQYAIPFKGKGPWDDGQWIFTLGLGINL